MVAAQRNIDERGEPAKAVNVAAVHILHEPMGTVLVRDVHVENRETKTGVIVKNLRHWNVHDLASTGRRFVLVF